MIPEFVNAEVIVQEAHSHRTWHAALPNGKKVIAFLDEGLPTTEFANGSKLFVRLSVTDFSRAEIVMPQPQ